MNAQNMPPNAEKSYPASDITAQQIESLISDTSELQKQVLRKFAKAILEEMRYHLWIAQEKCRMHERTIKDMEGVLAETKRKELETIILLVDAAGGQVEISPQRIIEAPNNLTLNRRDYRETGKIIFSVCETARKEAMLAAKPERDSETEAK